MTIKKTFLLLLATFIFICSSPIWATVGFGIHWGNDFSLNMDNTLKEQLSLEALSINPSDVAGDMPEGLDQISGTKLPIFINRLDWDRKPFNIGFKLFVDIIPVINAIELSTNFAIWEYKGSVTYPVSMGFRQNIDPQNMNHPDSIFDVQYDTLPVSLEKFDMAFLGLKNTPYMKLHFDLTIRKNIFEAPAKVFRVYAGAGPSLHFATPMLNKKLIEDAIGEVLEGTKSLNSLSSEAFDNYDISKKIVKKITSSLMIPHWGCHLIAGSMVKFPVIPLGFYIDGKLMIPFGGLDKNTDIGGFGFLLNCGISLSF